MAITFMDGFEAYEGVEKLVAPLMLNFGTPSVEGRYVIWTPCAALQVREWCEPSIALWHGGRWHSYDPPWAWIGPLPVVHGNDCLKQFQMSPVEDWLKPGETLQEYDL